MHASTTARRASLHLRNSVGADRPQPPTADHLTYGHARHCQVKGPADTRPILGLAALHRHCSAAVVGVQRVRLRLGGSSACIAQCCAVLYLPSGCRAWSAETVSPASLSCRACSCARTRRAHHDRSRRVLHMARPPRSRNRAAASASASAANTGPDRWLRVANNAGGHVSVTYIIIPVPVLPSRACSPRW